MINNLPSRLTTLHFAQRFFIDGDTFIIALLLNQITWLPSQRLDYTTFPKFRPVFGFPDGSKDCQDERFSFGDGD